MKNVKVDEFLNIKPNSFMVVCKEKIKNGKTCFEYICKQSFGEYSKPMNLSQNEKNKLIELSKIDPQEFIVNLIQIHLKDELITEIYEGNSSLLPSNFRQFYDKCVTISTENYQIYFNDLSIEKFKATILKLNERSKLDSLNFVKAKLANEKVNNMHLSLQQDFNFQKGRGVSFINNNEIYVGPPNTIYYSSSISKKGKVDNGDINNIITLMELFTKYKGLAKYANYNSDEMVIYYNNGSLKIEGMNKNSDMKERVHEKTKQLLKK